MMIMMMITIIIIIIIIHRWLLVTLTQAGCNECIISFKIELRS